MFKTNAKIIKECINVEAHRLLLAFVRISYKLKHFFKAGLYIALLKNTIFLYQVFTKLLSIRL